MTHISQTLSINKSTVFGILKALQAEGFVVKDPATKKYTMGLGLFELSATIFKRTDLATSRTLSLSSWQSGSKKR